MEPFRFLHCSDLHIDSPFKGLSFLRPELAQRLQRSTFQAYQNIVHLAIHEKVDAVLIAGDTFDGADQSLQAQLKFRRGLEQLTDAGIPVFIVQGNHDSQDRWSTTLRWPQGVTLFSTQKVEKYPVERNGHTLAHIYGISFPRRDVKDNLALKFTRHAEPGFAVGLLHANVGRQPGHDDYAPCSVDDLTKAGMDYWALGHIHAHQILRTADPAIVYPGNTQARHMGEADEKGCCLVTLHEQSPPEIRFIPTDVVRYVNEELDLSAAVSMDDVIRKVQNHCEGAGSRMNNRDVLIRLTLTGRTEMHSNLRKGGILEDLAAEIQACYEGQEPGIWLDLVLETQGTYDLEALKEGNDFIADILTLYDEVQSGDSKEELRTALEPLFESWQGRKYLNEYSESDLRHLLDQARILTMDQLIGRS